MAHIRDLVRGDGSLEGMGGLRLRYRAWEVESARAAMLVVHGLAEHGGRYGRLADANAAAGISTFALDLRGHGDSEGRRGHVPRFACYLQDLERFRREIRALIGHERPLLLFGHSLGGLVVLRYLQAYDATLAGGIVSAPWLAMAMPLPRWKRVLGSVLDRIGPAVPLPTGIDPDALCRDPEIVREYREDPAVHDRITPRLFAEARRAADLASERADEIGIPLLLLLAGSDRIVDTRRALRLARSGTAPVTVCVFPGYFHEVLNEPDSEAYAAIRDFVRDRLR